MISLEIDCYLNGNEGTDEDLLAMREHLPEPSSYKEFRYLVIKPRKFKALEFINYGKYPKFEKIETEEFEKTRIIGPGVSFWVWKSTRDGKFYI